MAQGSTIDLGQRRLAAIIFTDVVGFSARMQENETETLRLVERDSQFIKGVCDSFNGRILKSTGDGLLIFFDSAVDAVAAALKIQEELAQLRTTAAPNEVLEHRIGIHLGDVFIRDDDVMGDGVNIAARLQQEAQPGGICISQTVYEVVKNKLSLQVISLGPRELKNIREAVPAYQVLIEAQQALGGSIRSRAQRSSQTTRTLTIAAVVVVAAVAIWFVWSNQKPKDLPQAKVAVQATSVIPETKPAPPPSDPSAPPPMAVAAPVETPVATPAPTSTVVPVRPIPPSYEGAPPPEPPQGQAPPTHALQMSTRWIQGEMMGHYTKSNRLKVVPPPRLAAAATNMAPTTAWLEGTTLHFDVGGKDTPSDISKTAPIVLEYVLYSLTQAVGPNDVPAPIQRIFMGGPPPTGEPGMGGQQPPPMPSDGGMGQGGPPGPPQR